jgi:hypothetical protein
LSGPFASAALDGSKYIAIGVDYATNTVIDDYFTEKNDSNYIRMLEDVNTVAMACNNRLKHVHTDGAKEFLSDKVKSYLRKIQCTWSHNISYTSNDNPDPENRFNIIKDRIRATLLSSPLPAIFWKECSKCEVLGYADDGPGYLVYNTVTRKVVRSSSLTFHENNMLNSESDYYKDIRDCFPLNAISPVSDDLSNFNYLVNSIHKDDEDMLLYIVTRVVAEKGTRNIIAYIEPRIMKLLISEQKKVFLYIFVISSE